MLEYNDISFKLSKTITRKYSTSFSLGIHMLDRKFHSAIYAIYGFVRMADEIVDTFHDFDKLKLLTDYRFETYKALNEKISTNPVLHAFQLTVHQHGISRDVIDAFLHSMETDLDTKFHTVDTYNEYIYGSAEVVGLMCLKVFCEGNEEQYQSLIYPARKLGSAFQKINFLRDMKSDFKERGRNYFPGIDWDHFTNGEKKEIEDDIENDFEEGYAGIKRLPDGARLGVLVAYIYYHALFGKIKKLPANRIMEERIRVANQQKLALLVQTYFKYYLNVL